MLEVGQHERCSGDIADLLRRYGDVLQNAAVLGLVGVVAHGLQ